MRKKVNILLVDDRPEGLMALEAVLTDPEYNLIKANSGSEALSHILSHDFAVILMDVQMPGMDGFETASIIKKRDRSKNIPIIFTTALNKMDHHVSRGYSVGAVDYVFKPFDAHIIKSKVAIFVDLHKKNRLLQEQAEALGDIQRRDRLRILAELENEGRRRYQNLADAIPQIVFRTSAAGEVEYLNQFWHHYTGLSFMQSIGNGWKSILHPADLPELDKKLANSLQNRIGFEFECRFQQGQEVYRWHLFRFIPEFNQVSELICWIGTAMDIHDQKLVQQELLLAKQMAEVANETKSRFLANMSHEIRTPLGVILGFAELLMNPQASSTERRESMAVMKRNGEQLSKIIDDILDLSKVEAGKLDMTRSEVQIIELLNNVRIFMSLPAKEKGLDLHFALEGKIPTKIFTNQMRLQQILVNVIGNGIKFSHKGNVHVTISLQSMTEDKPTSLRVSVKDSGSGLTDSQIKNLFQPFSQVDTSVTRKYGGTGLGLALSRKLARALGGDILVDESAAGEGCDFVITVDVGDISGVPFTNTLELENRDLDQKHKSISLQGVKVLLVEDSVDNQVLVSRFLSMEGADVDVANNGIEGVNKAMNGNHNVVLMDIQMPELDGYGAITQLRQSGFKKPIIALTAHGMSDQRKYCLEIGSNDHLTKPVNRSILIQRVHQFSRALN